jgi:indolepyruvate ferredoxin oxidoreductase
MAYKDEYEVARLHLLSIEGARREAEFGPQPKVKILLQPPLLRALGLKRKLRLGRWAFGMLRLLYLMRGLRKTRLDPFGKTKVRRAERALITEYRDLVHAALDDLTPDDVSRTTQIAELPDLVRGYEEIKLEGIAAFRREADRLRSAAGPERRQPPGTWQVFVRSPKVSSRQRS